MNLSCHQVITRVADLPTWASPSNLHVISSFAWGIRKEVMHGQDQVAEHGTASSGCGTDLTLSESKCETIA